MLFNKQQLEIIKGMQTPFYYYDMALLEKTLKEASKQADKYGFHVHYALKANFNKRIIGLIQQYGFGADCVSGNEISKSIESGFTADKITFAGVGKSDFEINTALDHGIFAFNVESIQELEVIQELAYQKGVQANISLRINPNVDAKTHKYITTGLDDNKFGIPGEDLEKACTILQEAKNLTFLGLHFHIGSQITDLTVFENLCIKVNEWSQWFENQGMTIRVLNVGGGLGVDYHNPDENTIVNFEQYFSIFDRHLVRTVDQEVHFELGRSLVAQCGNLVSKVLYTKQSARTNFLILDAGMTELMRPALYQAYHKIERLGLDTANHTTQKYDVVGPICESSDTFGSKVDLPESQRGDLVAIRSAGAYGEVMASAYNLRNEIRHLYSDQLEKSK